MWESKIRHRWTHLQSRNRNRLTDTLTQTWHKPGWRQFIAKKSIWFWLGMGLPNFCKPCTNFWLPRWLRGKESACQCRRHRFDPWVGKIHWKRKWQPTPVFLPGKVHGQRSLAGCSPRDCKESGLTEQLSTNPVLPSLTSSWEFCRILKIHLNSTNNNRFLIVQRSRGSVKEYRLWYQTNLTLTGRLHWLCHLWHITWFFEV